MGITTLTTKRFGKVVLVGLFANESAGTAVAVIKYDHNVMDYITTSEGNKRAVGMVKKTETVKLESKIANGDKFNVYVGVALALVGLDFDSKNKFRKANYVDGVIVTSEAAALMMAYEGFGGKAEFEKFVDKNVILKSAK